MIDAVTLVLLALAVARLTRVVVADEVTAPLREAIVKRLGDPDTSKLSYLVHCPWCTGFWLSIPATVITYHLQGHIWWTLLLTIGAVSHVAGAIADR